MKNPQNVRYVTIKIPWKRVKCLGDIALFFRSTFSEHKSCAVKASDSGGKKVQHILVTVSSECETFPGMLGLVRESCDWLMMLVRPIKTDCDWLECWRNVWQGWSHTLTYHHL